MSALLHLPMLLPQYTAVNFKTLMTVASFSKNTMKAPLHSFQLQNQNLR